MRTWTLLAAVARSTRYRTHSGPGRSCKYSHRPDLRNDKSGTKPPFSSQGITHKERQITNNA
eukprot:9143461-Pyramimonas_sp.AAC.1